MRSVVITGIGAVTPIGNTAKLYWKNLLAGTNGIGRLTRFDTTDHKAKLAAEVRDFDPSLYMDKNEIRRTDLFSQFAMAAACQAVEDSGVAGQVEPERFGVYFGSGIGGLMTITAEMEKLFTKGPRRVSPHFIPMMISNLAAGNISIRHKAQGPCIPTVTACATSTNTIGEAFRAIKYGHADAIIAGGSEAGITPIALAGFSNMTALTCSEDPSAASIPFDKRRSGFVIGEGAGALILEEAGHAKKRGARIYAEICGYGATCDAYHVTAPDPDGACAARSIALALEEAGMESENRVYINAHGTSTPLNDVMETKAIKAVYGGRAGQLLVSSSKSMIGHTLGAAGAIEAIAAILALKEGVVPPTIGLIEPDPECDLDYVPGVKRGAALELALSVSFGFGGHNACVAFKQA